jgi:hypothetical protein
LAAALPELEHCEFAMMCNILARVKVGGYTPPEIVASSSARLLRRSRGRVARYAAMPESASLLVEQMVGYIAAERYPQLSAASSPLPLLRCRAPPGP